MAASSDMGTVTAQIPATTKLAKTQTIHSERSRTILVCQKSDCMKRGGKALCQALESELRNSGLEDSVTIKGTGCMKNCKSGPNLVMPDKTRYSKIQAEQVPALIDKHFSGDIREKAEDITVNIPSFVEV
jgi:NADH:ubiquinone oxidoreductase subunit E